MSRKTERAERKGFFTDLRAAEAKTEMLPDAESYPDAEPVVLPDAGKVLQELVEEARPTDVKAPRKPMSLEARKRLSEALKKRFSDPELKAKMSANAKLYWNSPGAKERLSESMKQAWTPQKRAAMSVRMKEAFARIKAAKKEADAEEEIAQVAADVQ
jgi:hypothetical protein